ncbi:MAG: thioredoxin domain-containing protein [Pseudomonadota bacterium]
MKNNRLIAVAAVALVCLVAIALYFSQNSSNPTDLPAGDLTVDTHYRVLGNPLQVADNGVSVIEFFWYGCPHCRDFEPGIKDWLASAPDDVQFELKPIVWNEATGLHAAMYYVGVNAERPAVLHEALFDQIIAVRKERELQKHVNSVGGLFAEHGVTGVQLADAINSSAVQQQVQQAEKDMRQAEVSSTPSVLIGGKYLILNNQAVGDKGMFNVMDSLIEMVRQSQVQ